VADYSLDLHPLPSREYWRPRCLDGVYSSAGSLASLVQEPVGWLRAALYSVPMHLVVKFEMTSEKDNEVVEVN